MTNYSFVKEVHQNNNLIGRTEELLFLKESMFKKRMKNTILVGPAGCGKTAILEQFAHDMDHFFTLVELDISACVAGTQWRGQFEERLINFLNDVAEFNKKNSKKILIFIDEIHTIYKAGGSEGAVDAGNILKSYLSRGEVTIIGATTLEEYRQTICRDKALNRRLSPIFIKELSDSVNLQILRNFNENVLSDDLLEFIYWESKKLNRSNPDISIEILDRCLAKKKFTGDIITKQTIRKIIKYIDDNEVIFND